MDDSVIQMIWQRRDIAYAVTDLELIVKEVNGPQGLICGEESKCVGRSLYEICPELVGFEEILEGVLKGKKDSIKLDFVNREGAAGETRYLAMEEMPRRDSSGRITGIVHLVQDITVRGELQQQITQSRNQLMLLQEQIERQNLELTAANTELRRLDELKSQFISVAAHELRTPLTSIMGFVEMLLDKQVGTLTEKQREYLEIVQQNGLRLLDLTNGLLEATRLEAGRTELVLKPEDLVALVKTVVSQFQSELSKRQQSLFEAYSPGLALVLCDKARVIQIVTNLMSNASKYTPAGGHLSVEVEPAKEAGYIQLTVADTGVGIQEDDQAKLFSRWFRTKEAAALNSMGSGLGLYITRALVELHGGKIWLESQPNLGSKFHVTFPLAM